MLYSSLNVSFVTLEHDKFLLFPLSKLKYKKNQMLLNIVVYETSDLYPQKDISLNHNIFKNLPSLQFQVVILCKTPKIISN